MYNILAMFFIYAFLGWCCEVIFAACVEGKFVNRGFLNGPVCPIYGVGATVVILCLTPIKDNLFILFIGSVVLTTVLEFLTGWVLERFFHQKWWDYSDAPFNIKGYVCLKFSLLWGIACVLVMDVVHPVVEGVINFIPKPLGIVLLVIFSAAIIVDLAVTVEAIVKIPKKLAVIDEVGAALHNVSDKVGGGLYNTTVKVKTKNAEFKNKLDEKKPELETAAEKYKAMLSKRSFVQKRIINAFPDLHRKNSAFKKLKDYMDRK